MAFLKSFFHWPIIYNCADSFFFLFFILLWRFRTSHSFIPVDDGVLENYSISRSMLMKFAHFKLKMLVSKFAKCLLVQIWISAGRCILRIWNCSWKTKNAIRNVKIKIQNQSREALEPDKHEYIMLTHMMIQFGCRFLCESKDTKELQKYSDWKSIQWNFAMKRMKDFIKALKRPLDSYFCEFIIFF